MKLTILGSGTGIPDKFRNAAGCVISINNRPHLFDSGPGIIRRLCDANFDLKSMHYFFYTHLHLDHVADLFPILFANKNIFRNAPRAPIHLYGPKGFRRFYLTIASAYENQILPENYKIYLRELSAGVIEFPDWQLTTCRVEHSQNSLAYRIDAADGRSIVYSGDTDFSPALIKLARRCDILILESAYPETNKASGHLIPSEAGRLAAEAECRKLILTHFYSPIDEEQVVNHCQKYFKGEIIIARDLMQIEI